MKMILTGLKSLEIQESEKPEQKKDFKLLKVQYCAVCKTDAKMWNQGHRELVFPRVLGHELVGVDENNNRFVVWPGKSCGKCRYCINGRENLCEEMKIMGFHNDGGYADYLLAPEKSLIPVPAGVSSHIACFAEPVGCVLNGVERLRLKKGERIIIYGGGSIGLIAALVCKDMGIDPVVIEKKEEKIKEVGDFLEATGIQCLKDTFESEFDAVINACPDYIAFNLGIVKIAKGGRYSFFSGLTKNENIETNLINLIHYKEAEIFGAYGLTRKNMIDAFPFMERNANHLEKLIEEIVPPEKAPELMPDVLSGNCLKYVLGFVHNHGGEQFEKNEEGHSRIETENFLSYKIKHENLSGKYRKVIDSIEPVCDEFYAAAQGKIDNKTKPLGSLGKLEKLSVQVCMIQGSLQPEVNKKNLFVFAADHGITEEGVSAFPSEVTGQMVDNFLKGGAAINVLCRHNNIDMKIVDMGVNSEFEEHPVLIKKKVRKGTRNFAIQEAMSKDEVVRAVENGMEVFLSSYSKEKIDIVGLGEMGIGNTTSASAIISSITGITPAQAAGRGTGVDDKGLELKIEVLENALNFHKPDSSDGFDILRKIGGYEIAGITGAVLAAASKKTVIVLDGMISTAAGLIAYAINPDIKGYLISGHKSVEISQKAALLHMGLEPVIDFNMRLGEGTGAALAIDTVEAACKIIKEMATFDEAGVSNKEN